MIYLNPLPDTRQQLIDLIAALELRRERQRALGRLTPERARQIAAELSELRQRLAVVSAKEAA